MNERLVEAETRCALALIERREPTVEEERPLIEFVRSLDERPEVRLLLLQRFRERRDERVGHLEGTLRAAAAGSGSTSVMSGRASGGGSWLIEAIGPPTFGGAPLQEGECDGLPAD
jgi:hypothetical protein